jgi:hypothetical protein
MVILSIPALVVSVMTIDNVPEECLPLLTGREKNHTKAKIVERKLLFTSYLLLMNSCPKKP